VRNEKGAGGYEKAECLFIAFSLFYDNGLRVSDPPGVASEYL
jgi:hypothetical protein